MGKATKPRQLFQSIRHMHCGDRSLLILWSSPAMQVVCFREFFNKSFLVDASCRWQQNWSWHYIDAIVEGLGPKFLNTLIVMKIVFLDRCVNWSDTCCFSRFCINLRGYVHDKCTVNQRMHHGLVIPFWPSPNRRVVLLPRVGKDLNGSGRWSLWKQLRSKVACNR